MSRQGRFDHLLKEISVPGSLSPERRKVPGTEISKEQKVPGTAKNPKPVPQQEEKKNDVLSVSDLNRAIKRQLEGEFPTLWVQGEISNFKAHTSGHWYFSLKDEKAQVNAVMFKGYNSRLRFRPESGMEVVVRGKISVYEPRGNYQVFCEGMEPVGAGALQKAFEQLKAKLQSEGLFEQSRKKVLPSHPKKIGVVTSPTGAAIQDILNVLGRRSKRAQVVVIPARVQGDGAAAEVVRGIKLANQIDEFDVLIVGRGGGSIEDLWCFNEEVVARAIAKSKIPVISAVGHEIDFTIADFVADRRAPTPSAAAEIVAASEQELLEKLKFFSKSLRLLVYQKINEEKKHIQSLQRGLIDPRRYLQDCILRLDDWTQRLSRATLQRLSNLKNKVELRTNGLTNPQTHINKSRQSLDGAKKLLWVALQHQLKTSRSQLGAASQMLDSLSPLRVVDRGYGIVRSGGELVADAKNLKDKKIEIELRDGYIDATVDGTRKK